MARSARLVLCVAALLSVGGSFGLHPEPADSSFLSPAAAPSDGSPELRKAAAQRHGCIACLSQRPHALTSVIDAHSARMRVVSYAPPPALPHPQRLHTADHEGRAPPTAS